MAGVKNYQRQTPGELAAAWEMGEGVHARNRVSIARGIVEYNRDPDRRGRVMVRTIHDGPEMNIEDGKKPRVATFTLGWCTPLFSFGSGMGFGSFTVPPVGARVYVMWEHGDPENGVYFGGWYANAPKPRRYGATQTTLEPPLKPYDDIDGYNSDGELGGDYYYPPKPTPYHDHWDEPQGPEMPLELADMFDHTPDTQLFFKTLKGASLLVKERDEVEELVLTDHLGAELRFESNTNLMETGVNRRGIGSATRNERVGIDNLAHFKHTVSLVNAMNAGLELQAGNVLDDNHIELSVHGSGDTYRNMMSVDDRVSLELDRGEQRMRLCYKDGGQTAAEFVLDKIGHRLDIRGNDVHGMHMEASELMTLTAGRIKITGDVDIEGEVRHFGDTKVSFMEMDMEPYGTAFRNWWPYDARMTPYTEDHTKWGQSWERTREYRR